MDKRLSKMGQAIVRKGHVMSRLGMSFGVVVAAAFFAVQTAGAAPVQVGDFRLSTNTVGQTYVPYDTFSFATRAVTGAPTQVVSTFAGTSQNNDGTATDDTGTAQDLALATFTASTTKAGAAAWTFSLNNVATYATANAATVNAVSARLVTAVTAGYPYDVYLSYTSAADGLTQTAISDVEETNYSTFFAPARAAAVGDKVGGKYVLLAKDVSTSLDLTTDLTAAYAAGARGFTLVIASAAFGSNRVINVNAGSGVYLDASVPEPATLAAVGAGAVVLLGRRRRSNG
jgi:hypothetical protein